MIPSEVADIATLIFPHWTELDECDEEARKEIVAAAYCIYEAGYRLPVTND